MSEQEAAGAAVDAGAPGWPDDPASRPLFLAKMARLLGDFERAGPGTSEQVVAFATLREAFPGVGLTTRVEPRAAFAQLIEASNREDEEAIADATEKLIAQDYLDDEDLPTLLLVEADSGVVLPEHTLFLVAERLVDADSGFDGDEAYPALVTLAGANWVTVVSLLERLMSADRPQVPAFYAGLQSIASYAPVHLGALFAMYAPLFADDAVNVEALRYLLRDLCRRAGPYTTLLALAEPVPERCPKLLAAGFSGGKSPFHFEQALFEDEEAQEIQIADDVRKYPLTEERLGKPVQEWIADVRKAVRESSPAGPAGAPLDTAEVVHSIAVKLRRPKWATRHVSALMVKADNFFAIRAP